MIEKLWEVMTAARHIGCSGDVAYLVPGTFCDQMSAYINKFISRQPRRRRMRRGGEEEEEEEEQHVVEEVM